MPSNRLAPRALGAKAEQGEKVGEIG